MIKKICLILIAFIILDTPMVLWPVQSNLNPWLYNRVSLQDAFKQIKIYTNTIIKEFNIEIETTTQQALLHKTGLMLLHYGPRLTPKKVKKIKKQLKQYLFLTFPHNYQKGAPKEMFLVPYARQAISFALTQYIMDNMKIESPELIRTYKRSLYKSIKEDIFAHQRMLTSGHPALSSRNIKIIINNAINRLKNIDPATDQSIHEFAHKTEQEALREKKRLSRSKRSRNKIKKSEFFFESIESARIAIQEEIREQGIPPQEREKLLHTIIKNILHQPDGKAPISENLVYHVTLDTIKDYKEQQSNICAICTKSIPRRSYFNKRTYRCGHVVHKTCLFKKSGKHYYYQGMRYGKCPDCEMPKIQETE